MTLRAATGFFAVGFALHHLDHLRRGYATVDDQVVLGRTVAAMLAAVLFTLVLIDHRRAANAAVIVGAAVLLGVLIVRVLPPFGLPSDHLGAAGVSAWSWLAVGIELVGAATLIAVGLKHLRAARSIE